MAVQYSHVSFTATTTAAATTVNVEEVLLISNDSTGSDNLLISLQDDVAGDYIVLKPGESYKNLPVSVYKIWVKSSANTVAGRFFGLQK